MEFPADFFVNLEAGLIALRKRSPEHGPVGVAGAIVKDGKKHVLGQIWHQGRDIGEPVVLEERVDTLDEVCVILRANRTWWLNDTDLMRHHLWAAELCLREAQGGSPHLSYVLPGLYLKHHSETPLEVSDPAFYFNAGVISALYRLPKGTIGTTCCTVYDPKDDTGIQIVA